MEATENSEQGQPLAVPLQRPVRPAFIREHGHPDVVRGDAVPVVPGQRVELVLWEDMEAEVRRAVAAERERWAKLCDAAVRMLQASGYHQAAASIASVADDIRA